MDTRREWIRTKDELVDAIVALGQPAQLGEQIARQLGSPKAMERMIAYLHYEKPHTAELIVDEMLAICSDIENWKNKKIGQEANARYNEMLEEGLGTGDEEDFM